MLLYTAKRVGIAFLTLFVIVSATWLLVRFLPGSPFNDAKLTDAARAQLEAKYGLNDPLPVQYLRYLGNVAHGDLGTSFYFQGRPVTTIIAERLPVSAFIAAQAIVIGLIFGLVLGVVAALRRNSLADSGSMTLAVVGISLPSFVLAPLLQYFIAIKLGWLPIAGFDSYTYSILPSLSLSVLVVATIARFARTEMVEVLGQDYITLAEAKGISRLAVIVRHTLRNAMIPLVTVLFPLIVGLVTGSIVIEQIFVVPGIGSQFISAIAVNDYTMILGLALFFSALFVAALLIQDILYGIIDPRIRVSGKKE